MRMVIAVVLLSCARVAAAQAPQVADTALPTGTHVRFWLHDAPGKGGLEGSVIRFTPTGGSACLGIHSEAVPGFISIQRVDSLQASGHGPAHSDGNAAWRRIPVAALKAAEHGCGPR